MQSYFNILPNDVFFKIEDELETPHKLKSRELSLEFRNYFNYIVTPYNLPLYDWIKLIFSENKDFLQQLPINNKQNHILHLAIVTKFSELCTDFLFSFVMSKAFDFELWLRKHPDFLEFLNTLIIIPNEMEFKKAKQSVEDKTWYPDQSMYRNEGYTHKATTTEILIYNSYLFKTEKSLEDKVNYSTKILEILIKLENLNKYSLKKTITQALVRMLDATSKKRFREVLNKTDNDELITTLFFYCFKKIYNQDVRLSDDILKSVKEMLISSLRYLDLPSSATIKIIHPSVSSKSSWAIGISLPTENDAKHIHNSLTNKQIKARKGRYLDEWQIHIVDYLPIEIVAALGCESKNLINNRL